jgi:putative PIG3 family NAD(P)H quinone oxidoreductase
MDIPSSMLAVEIAQPGDPDVLRTVQRAVPRPADGEVLIRVDAAGVNRPDIMQRLGKYPPPPGASDIPGLEIAGVVVAGNSADFKTGDRVCALVAGGGYAEYCAVPRQQILPVPDGLGDVECAAIPETFFTVWTNLFERGGLRTGETVLVHGGSSGIGTTAIQLARVFGATVFATAGTDDKCAACERLGASYAINYQTEDFVTAVRHATGGVGVDVILDIVGGDYLPRNLECLALNGRLVQIGLMGGAKAAINLRLVLQKRLAILGSTLRARTPDEKGLIAKAVRKAVWPLLARGEVRPIIHRTFPLDRAADAHAELESGRVIGKVVLTVGSTA